MIKPFLRDPIVFQKSEIPINHLGFCWLGQGGYLFRTHSNVNICVDPYLSDSVTCMKGLHRITPIPIVPQNLRVNYVLITHEHLDHLDPGTICGLTKANPEAVFIAQQKERLLSLGVKNELILYPKVFSDLALRGFSVTAVPAVHQVPACGFVISIDRTQIYLSGDTLYDDSLFLIARYTPDIMFVCINDKLGNMNAEEAAGLTQVIKPSLVIPAHYGMFAENTIDPQAFIAELQRLDYTGDAHILEPGQSYLFEQKAGFKV